jgi:hypothetical protein
MDFKKFKRSRSAQACAESPEKHKQMAEKNAALKYSLRVRQELGMRDLDAAEEVRLQEVQKEAGEGQAQADQNHGPALLSPLAQDSLVSLHILAEASDQVYGDEL